MTPARASAWILSSLLAVGAAGATRAPTGAQGGSAFFVRSLHDAAERREARPDILDAPILPGSVMKTVTLVAALESQVIEPDTTRICRRTVTVDGRRYTCSHPDVKRPLTPAEALAHSCNHFFVSLAPRLSRAFFNDVRARVGLAPVSASANLAAALVGLDGPRVTPRVLLDVVSRLAGADAERPVVLQESTRRVLLEGLRGAAQYGSAAALGTRGLVALAKTGTAPMPGGAWMGIVVALEPADKPTRGIVVVAPGAAGLDAAAIAADLLSAGRGGSLDPPFVRVGMTAANGRTSVARLALDDYVARVLAGEGQPGAAAAAQQALAITARTFALANLNRHRREGFDFCDTTHCQVVRSSTDVTRRAAEATAGRVLVHQGQPATVFYSALCGGRSELASEVWPGAIDYQSASHADEACREEPGWESDIRAEQIERALREAGQRGDRLRSLRILERNASGRVSRILAEGFIPGELSGHDFRMAVARVAGWQRMKSTAFDVRRTSAGYQFRGRGFGHGVGLCVIGAGHRAADGTSADEILRFYFPSLQVETYRGTPAASANRASSPVSRPASAEIRADVLLTLPAGDETERSRLVQLVRAARDQIAGTAGVKPPASIRVTVHPTVEAFGRATGQPWWVSGATDRVDIDLVPLGILRQRGQLERTIRHEVAHVLVDARIDHRPLWVREGAALYFADPATAPASRGRTSCPRDEEFLRPVSAGAHRSAYARAEACFRRAVSEGRRWQDIR